MKQILFINGSPNKNGNTAAAAHRMLCGKAYETLHLVDYKIYPLGQISNNDQFDDVMRKIAQADILAMGSPVYWHSMARQFRTLLERIYESQQNNHLAGKELYFIFQVAAPSPSILKAGNYTMGFFADCSSCAIAA